MRGARWRYGGRGVTWTVLAAAITALLLTAGMAAAPTAQMQLPETTRKWFRNPDGSCVQCSIGMAAVHTNQPQATTLLWDTVYGRAERGGSWPDRVAEYCNRRNIRAWNVTGSRTYDWMRWAAKTGRFAAIGAGRAHFQTLYGYDEDTKTWYVCNNNSTHKIDQYTDEQFRRLHAASGPWVVVLKEASPDVPKVHPWWEN